jgi:two-component sensor histidine kinase
VRDCLAAAGLQELSESAELLVSELVTNSLLHARTRMRIEVLHTSSPGPLVQVGVHDQCPALGARRPFNAEATTGRGLQLVEALADEWGTDNTDWGKVTWFSVGRSAGQVLLSSGS